MDKKAGLTTISAIRQNLIACKLTAGLLYTASAVLAASALLPYLLPVSGWWLFLFFCLALFVTWMISQPWKITLLQVSLLLNKAYPTLEESAELALKPPHKLTLLQQLQLKKTEGALRQLPLLPWWLTRPLLPAGTFLLCAAAFYIVVANIPIRPAMRQHLSAQNNKGPAALKEKILPQISSVSLTITPPPYTKKPARKQDKFTIVAEEGAIVTWRLHTNIAVKQVSLLFNGGRKVPLRSGINKMAWSAACQVTAPGFYQVSIDGRLSDLYQVKTIKDGPPVIRIKTPKPYTYIDAGEKPAVPLNVSINDDYGVSNAVINATVARGSGEGVTFKEYKIPFHISFAQHKEVYSLQHMFDLPALNMGMGDELYFYVEAQDNHQQKSRTDVYTVSIQDTASLLSMNGMMTGVNVKPEFFRSERQIIMDTEKLLKEADSLTTVKFNATSNDLANDQKLLRLRYGKFLGEESESDIGGPGSNSELAKIENFNNAAMLLDAYTDKHDNAEDATFFEPGVKTQLKATLTEMWKAELQLRLYKPRQALPFEYKALRLLKDLQQKSRAYVAKTAYNPTPLKPEKRLTGELDKIIQPENFSDIVIDDDFKTLKNTLPVLERLKTTRQLTAADRYNLQITGRQLGVRASVQPGAYLPALRAINRLLSAGNGLAPQDIAAVEKAIQATLPAAVQLPQNAGSVADMGLSGYYFKNLKHANR